PIRDFNYHHEWWVWNVGKHVKLAVEAGCITQDEAQEMDSWMKFIEPLIGERSADTLVHKDIHPWNLMVDAKSYELTAILDWGDAMMGDVSSEFAAMPLAAVPPMFQGYAGAGEAVDERMIAKSLYAGLGLS